jgi:Uma2 family endonuclease
MADTRSVHRSGRVRGLEDKEAERGAEPDECYVFGDVDAPDRPDLAIEVVWTSGRIDKLDVYRKLGVKEIWYWRKGEIHPYVLRGAQYKRGARSKALPALDLVELASFVEHGSTSRAIRAYRTSLRKRLGKRR